MAPAAYGYTSIAERPPPSCSLSALSTGADNSTSLLSPIRSVRMTSIRIAFSSLRPGRRGADHRRQASVTRS